LRTKVNQPTCKSGRPTEDGSRCSSTLVTLSKMKEDSMSVSRTNQMLWSKRTSATHGADGKSDMSRTCKPTKLVSIIQNMDSTVIEISILSLREMEDTCPLSADKFSSRPESIPKGKSGNSTAMLKQLYPKKQAEIKFWRLSAMETPEIWSLIHVA
jgi:hypothetical protein